MSLNKLHSFLIITTVIISSCINTTAQESSNIYLTSTGSDDKEIVSVGDPVIFGVNIYNEPNTGENYDTPYLDITIPDNWKFIEIVSAGLTAIQQSDKNTYRVEIPQLQLQENIDVNFKLQPLCAPSATDTLKYKFYSKENELLAEAKLQTSGNVKSVTLDPRFPLGMLVDWLNSPTTINDTIRQTGVGSYIKQIKIDVTCDTSTIKIHNIEYLRDDDNYYPIDMSANFEKHIDGYTFYFDENVISSLGNRDTYLRENEALIFRETISYQDCYKSGEIVYKISYGNGEEWCHHNNITRNVFLKSRAYNPDMYLQRNNQYPTKSDGTGNGKRVFHVMNTLNSSDIASTLRNLRFLIYTQRSYFHNNRVHTVIAKAYFCDADGNRLANTPDIPLSNNVPLKNQDGRPLYDLNTTDGIFQEPGSTGTSRLKEYTANPHIYVVSFDSLPEGAINNVPLISIDGNNIYDDLPPGESFYFAVEYYNAYNHVKYLDSQGNYITDVNQTGFALFHRVYGILFFQNECNDYFGYSRPYGTINNTSCHPDTEVCVGEPPTDFDGIINISTGDNLTLKFSIPPQRSGLSRTRYLIDKELIQTIYNHTVHVTLPEGFEYDSNIGITIANTPVNGADIRYNDLTREIIFRNKISFANNVEVKIGTKATGSLLNDHIVDYKFSFNCEGEDPVIYQGYKKYIEFNQILPCSSGLEMIDFKAERTTFGYTDNTMTGRANRNTPGINLHAAGPYDNVTMQGLIYIQEDINLSATDQLVAKISYQYPANQDYFDFPDKTETAVIRRKKFGSNNYEKVLSIPFNELQINVTDPNHEAFIYLTDYVNNGTLSLLHGDSIQVELFTQTTELIPVEPTDISQFKMEIYIEKENHEIIQCDPYSTTFTLFNYKLAALNAASGGGDTYYANKSELTDGCIFRWYLGNGSIGGSEIFTNEFRPNSIYQEGTFELDGLFVINNIEVRHNANNANTSASNATVYNGNYLIEGDDYTVSYGMGKTTIKFNNTTSSRIKTAEYWGSYGGGTNYRINFTAIGTNSNQPQLLKQTIIATDYPTSENKIENKVYRNNTANIVVSWYDYSIRDLSTSSYSYMPTTNIAHWDFTITNNSSWATEDGVLPHSWVSLEGSGNIIEQAWLYNADNNLQLGEFIKISDDKYWLKFADVLNEELNINSSKTFYLRVKYKSCGGESDPIKLTYGMSNVTYPDDPWSGYATQYNTPFVYNTKSINFIIVSPISDFSVSMKDDESIQENGVYTLCEPIAIETSFHNGNQAIIDNLKVKIKLQNHMNFYQEEGYTPKIKIDEGTYYDFNGTINQGAGYAELVLPPDLELKSNGSTGSKISVKFYLEPECGYISSLVQTELSGQNLCGDIISKPANSRPIRVGETTIPSLNIQDVKINGTNATNNVVSVPYKNASEGNFTLTMDYHWNYLDSDILFAYVDIPNNIKVISSKLGQPDGLSDVSFTPELDGQTGATITRYKAKMNKPQNFEASGQPYYAELKLQAQNPTQWDCSDHSIYIWSAITSSIMCHEQLCETYSVTAAGNAKIRMEKIPLVLSDIKATSQFNNFDSEKVTFTGSIINGSDVLLPSAMVEVFVYKNGVYTPASGNNMEFTINNIPANNGTTDFTATFDIKSDEVCNLVLTLRPEKNPYVCSNTTPIIFVDYQFSQNRTTICQDISTKLGDPAINGYNYSWTPPLYLSDPTKAQPEFSFSNAIAETDSIKYTLSITRENGCTEQDTLWVIINPQPVINTNSTVSSPGAAINLETLVSNLTENTTVSFFSDPEAVQIINSSVSPSVTTIYYARSQHNTSGCLSEIKAIEIKILLSAIWTPENNPSSQDSDKTNWYDPSNWNEKIVPLEYSNVYIPGNVTHFPYLTGLAKCNNIYFMHGAEIGQLQNLEYKKAFIQLNFGLDNSTQQISDDTTDHLAFSAQKSGTPLSRNKWHMLSAPLHDMVSGDFSLGGYPASYMRKFDATQPESGSVLVGNWTQFYTSPIIGLSPGEGFILWMNKYDARPKYMEYGNGIDEHVAAGIYREYGLKQINGILEFPYYENEEMSTAHRIHKSNGNTSTFHYVMENENYPNYMDVLEKNESYIRSSKAYTLHNENYTYPIKVTNGVKVALVGNPYMSTIDFNKFYSDNNQYIKPNFQIWTGDKFSTYTPEGLELDQYIAPMQAFLIEIKENITTDFLVHFNIANISVARPTDSNSKLRVHSKNTPTNVLRIQAINDYGTTVTNIVRDTEGSGSVITNKDSRKIISGIRQLPEVYTLKSNHLDKTGVGSNIIASNDITIPLALASVSKGTTVFHLSGMDQYEADITFIDNYEDYEKHISGMESFTYDFDFTPQLINDEVSPVEDRFYIRFSPKTFIENDDDLANINAYVNHSGIHILSTSNNPIINLAVYDSQGRICYVKEGIQTSYHTIRDKNQFPQIIIIKITTEKGVKNIKLITK